MAEKKSNGLKKIFRSKVTGFMAVVCLSCTIVLTSCNNATTTCERKAGTDEEVLFFEDFNRYQGKSELPAQWWYEGSKAVCIENGHLRIDANPDNSGENYPVSTVWLNKVFSGDLRIEFDAHVLASEPNANNINLFLLYSDPSGKPLQQTKQTRADGRYRKYHNLNGYIITYLVNNSPKARFRLRDCPGFNLISENYDYECKKGKTYHIVVTKLGNRITYAVDGFVFLDMTDNVKNPEHKRGHIGFRTFKTELWWDNLKVTKI